MAISVTHTFVSAISDGGDSTLVQPSNWNAAHTLSGFGTGVETALAIAVGSAGAPVLFNGALGTPSSGTLTNATGLPVSSGISGLGTGIATALAVNTGSAGAPVLFDGALGTPSSGTLTNATGLPISTGVSGLGTGVATFLATPSSANLASAVTDETGSGALVFGTAPVFPTTITVGAASGATGQILLKGTTSGTVTIKTADAAGTYTLTLPADDGDSGEVLTTNGSGVLTWEAGGGTPTAITVADEASDTTCFPAFFTAATGDLGPKTNSALTFNSSTGLLGATSLQAGSSGTIGLSTDTLLVRDGAADTLAQQRTTNAQVLRGYRTFTDSSNYERWALQSGAGYFELAAQTAGTGTDNISLRLTPVGTGGVQINIAGTSSAPALNFLQDAVGWYRNASGQWTWAGTSVNYLSLIGDIMRLKSTFMISWTSGESTIAADTGISRNAAGVIEVNNASAGTLRDIKVRSLLTPMTSELTIASGVVTATGGFHNIDTEADAASDDLDTINGGVDGMRLVIRANNAGRTVTVKDGTGNIQCAGDFALDNTQDTMELIYDSTLTAWLEIGRTDSGA
jgi:hypothetical protein